MVLLFIYQFLSIASQSTMQKIAKKFLPVFVLLLALSFTFNTTSASALTSDQINAIISLVRSFGVDEAVIRNVDDSLNGRTPTATSGTSSQPATFCYNWTRNLRVGDKGTDVGYLQTALEKFGLSISDNDKPQRDGQTIADSSFGESTASAISEFQEKYASDILTPNGLRRGNGYVGASTRAKLNRLYGCIKPHPDSVPPVISGVSGPQTLDVNQQGTWTVKASSPNGGNLSYSVVWGDESVYPYATTDTAPAMSERQSATFTHSYSQAGTYTPIFTVASPNTIACITTPCPSNGGSAKTSLTVKVGSTQINYPISILSPKHGDVVSVGSPVRIDWGAFGNADNSAVFDITEFTDSGKDNLVEGVTQTQAGCLGYGKGVCSYIWTPTSASSKFKIAVSQRGTNNIGYSGIFSVVSSSEPSMTVLSPNGGEVYKLGDKVTLTWSPANVGVKQVELIPFGQKEFSSLEGLVIYSLKVRGDATAYGGSVQIEIPTALAGLGYGQTALYYAQITTEDGRIDISDKPFSIVNPGPIQPSITVLSPNGGGSYKAGESVLITWSSQNLPTGGTVILTLDSDSQGSSAGGYVYGVTNTGSASVTIPLATRVASDYRAKVTYKVNPNTDGASYQDSSDSYFSITAPATTQPAITVTSPTSGQTFAQGSVVPIRWTSQNFSGGIAVDVQTASGNISLISTSLVGNPGTYDFTLSASTVPGSYVARVRGSGGLMATVPFTVSSTTSNQ